jgi:hypothetical protein
MIGLLAVAIAASLHLEAEPRRLELTDDSVHAVLRIRSQLEPRLSASVGTISNLRRETSDAWTADYLPPPESYPQVAVIAAVAGGELSWTALPLSGQGTAVVQTRPGAEISVEIGQRSFGPVKADKRGEAQVPVVVPPGVHEVRHLGKRIDLPVPEALRVHVVLMEDRVRADRVEKVHVRILAVDEAGKALPHFRLALKPGRGKLSPLERHGAGEMWTTWTVPAGASGSIPLRVSLAGSPRLVAEAALGIGPGPAATVELKADRESIVAGRRTEVVLRARARDSAGNPSPDVLDASGPDGFGTLVETGPGAFRLRVPDSFGGRTSIELSAHPRGKATPRGSVTIRLLPAEPVAASMDPEAASVRTGGGELKIRIRRTDKFGNLVPGAQPEAFAEEGSVGAIETLPDGSYLAAYRAPARWDRDDTLVEARWPGTFTQRRLTLVPRLSWLALAPEIGVTSNFARLTSPVAGLSASVRSDRFGPELALTAEAAWSFKSQKQNVGTLGTAQARDDFFGLSAQLSVRKKLGLRTTIWGGAGPSLQMVSSRLQLTGQPRISESAIVPGAILSLGLEHRFVSAVPFAELRWSIHSDPALSTLSGSLSALSLIVGNHFELF